MINVTKTYMPKREKFDQYLDDVWTSSQLTNNGKLSKQLSVSLQEYLDVENLELVSNGTLALQLAIKSLEISGEIITTPFSYVATTTSILWENCKPVFVDIDDNSLCIDTSLIERAITPSTSAILVTHVYGFPCNVEKIQDIADKYELKVIYDAAHAFGVKYNGRSLLSYGDASTLSFHATKLFHSVEGGAIVSRTKKASESVALLKSFGHIGEENYIGVGINAKMSELHAAMGLCILDDMSEIISKRKEVSEHYDFLLSHNQKLIIPKPRANTEYNYAYYPVIFNSREVMERVRLKLNDNEIFPRRYFYPSLNTLSYINVQYSCPVSESISERVLALPLSTEITINDVKLIAGIVNMELT